MTPEGQPRPACFLPSEKIWTEAATCAPFLSQPASWRLLRVHDSRQPNPRLHANRSKNRKTTQQQTDEHGRSFGVKGAFPHPAAAKVWTNTFTHSALKFLGSLEEKTSRESNFFPRPFFPRPRPRFTDPCASFPNGLLVLSHYLHCAHGFLNWANVFNVIFAGFLFDGCRSYIDQPNLKRLLMSTNIVSHTAIDQTNTLSNKIYPVPRHVDSRSFCVWKRTRETGYHNMLLETLTMRRTRLVSDLAKYIFKNHVIQLMSHTIKINPILVIHWNAQHCRHRIWKNLSNSCCKYW